MKYCSFCGHANPDGAMFCGGCGRPFSQSGTGTVRMYEDNVAWTISVVQHGKCEYCDGEGERTCTTCGGSGSYYYGMMGGTCMSCGGSGKLSCPYCGGSGER